MLERAAQCLENAGQRFLCHHRNGIRTRRTLHPRFWHHRTVDLDVPLWYYGFLQSIESSAAATSEDSRTHVNAYAKETYLDFLYPPRTQFLPQSPVSRHRRKRPIGARAYSSGPASVPEPNGGAIDHSLSKTSEDGGDAHVLASQDDYKLQDLQSLLDTPGFTRDFDKAWDIYTALDDCPKKVRSKLLLYLSDSDRRVDARRLKTLFETIPEGNRSEQDYWCKTKALLRLRPGSDAAIDVCNEAVSKLKGQACWGFAIAVFVSRSDWDRALKLWRNKPYAPSHLSKLQLKSDELQRLTTLPDRLLELASAIDQGTLQLSTPGLGPLTKFLAYTVFSSKRALSSMSIDSILELFKKLNSTSLLEARFYYRAITTQAALDTQSGFVRAIVLYRNFRWVMKNVQPPERVLITLLRMLCNLEVFEGVHYLMDEFRRFYSVPPTEAYQLALMTFSRLGDVPNVQQTFESCCRDHGTPTDLKLITPLLYVYARIGEVPETMEQLDTMTERFGVAPNVVCWNILLAAYANNGDASGAMAAMNKMLDTGLKPDGYTFGTMMGIMAKRGDITGVMNLLRAARRHGVEINSVLIDTVIETLCNNRKYAEAESLAVQASKVKPLGPLTRTFNILLWNYAFMSDTRAMVRVQDTMRKARIVWDGMTYAALMLSLVVSRRVEQARYILSLLHRNERIQVTELHYAIVLHGYVKSKNRNMVHILYKEICERFKDPNPSSKLAMLKMAIQRDLQVLSENRGLDGDVELTNAEKFLETVMENFDVKTYATKLHQVGVGRRTIREAFPVAYYEHLIAEYGSQNAFERARSLFDEYRFHRQLHTGEEREMVPPLRLLQIIMLNYVKEGLHDKVEECWELAYKRTVALAAPTLSAADIDRLSPPGSLPENNDAGSKIPGSSSQTSDRNEQTETAVVPSYRYALTYCLSALMESLAVRSRHSQIFEVIAQLEKVGFRLTTHNWALCVKLLCLSQNPRDQWRAFKIFEDKFIDNFPGWNYIKRSYVKRPPKAPRSLDLMEEYWKRGKPATMMGKEGRALWSKIQPEYMQPTYVTMVYLASALIDFKTRAVVDGGIEMRQLASECPKTFDTVVDMPYLREKFQGILLRGVEMVPDAETPREMTTRGKVWPGGLLGKGRREVGLDPVSKRVHTKHPEPRNRRLKGLLAVDARWRHTRREMARRQAPPRKVRTLRPQDVQDIEHNAQPRAREVAKAQLEKRKRSWKRRLPKIDKDTDTSAGPTRQHGRRSVIAMKNAGLSFMRHV